MHVWEKRPFKLRCKNLSFKGLKSSGFMQVFIIGPVKQVRKAEAMLRGRMLEMY